MRVLVILLSIISCQSTTDPEFYTPSPHFPPISNNGFMTNESFMTPIVGAESPEPQLSSTSSSSVTKSRIVETKYGQLQGISLTLFPTLNKNGNSNGSPIRNNVVEIFLGVPYASPPIRFTPTQTPIPWEGVKTVDKPSPVCPQMFPNIRNEAEALKDMPKGYLEYLKRIEPYLRNQSESDCLTLNIYSPRGPEPRLKPVLVYVHGGKFMWGSGNLVDGTVLSAYGDIVFVSFNYRLGALGFLNMNPSPFRKAQVSNYGLLDQIAAVHWIKENIVFFGGDPENITLMGYEAGASSINFLMSSPAVMPGLFHRSILIAGSSSAPWALVSDPANVGNALAQNLNCTPLSNYSSSISNSSISSNSTMSFLTSSSTSQFSQQGKSYGHHQPSSLDPIMDCLKTRHFSHFSTNFSPPNKFSVNFGPTVDGVVIKPYFRTTKDSIGKRDLIKKYDLLFGLSSLEKMTEFSDFDLNFGFEGARRDAILRTLIRNSYRFHLNEILATIINEYIDWEKSNQHPIPIRDLTVNAVTDCLSLAPIVAASESSQINKAYFYVFDYATKDGLYNSYQRSGAAGGEELSYIFGHPLIELVHGQVLSFVPTPLPSNFTKNEMVLSELLITYISNFAHSSDPNEPSRVDLNWPLSKEKNRFRNIPWESYDKNHQKYLEITGTKVKMKSHYRAHQMSIWLRLIPELQRSGAHYATNLHNRLKGGNDPSLYVGSVRNNLIETDEVNPLFDIGFGIGTVDEGNNSDHHNNPPSPPTTCFSPVYSAKNSSSGTSSYGTKEKHHNDTTTPATPTAFDVSNLFAPYSTALSVTIAIGCSLLILNVFIFALVYYQRDKRRAQQLKDSQSSDLQTEQQKYSEPPELLKSNTTSVIHHQSNSVSSQTNQAGTSAGQQFDTYSIQSGASGSGCSSSHHQPHQPISQRGILLSPQQAHAHLNHQHIAHYASQIYGLGTIPRSNGGLNMSSLPKPPPPPRSITNFATLPHNRGGPHICHTGTQMIPTSSSSQKLTPYEELNV